MMLGQSSAKPYQARRLFSLFFLFSFLCHITP